MISPNDRADWRQRLLFRAIGRLRRSICAGPEWLALADLLGLGAPGHLLAIQAILRRPGLTVGGYADYLPGYAPGVLLGWLERLVASRALHITGRSKYWPGPSASWWADQIAGASGQNPAGWERLPPARLATLAEQTGRMVGAIPAGSLITHPLYAYGPRSPAAPASSAVSDVLALGNYHSDAYRLAWRSSRLPPGRGVLLRLCLGAGDAPDATALVRAARPYLGDAASATIEELLADGWLAGDRRGLRLTASGWSAALAIELAVRQECAPLAAVLSDTEIRGLAQSAAWIAARPDAGYRLSAVGNHSPDR